ncbi:MAG TPA: PEP-CTERM sorting domain-containing protein, partial [Fimbriimonadaceae bacterium]|nr:PEP-CTERM sorting domain-containing protein [Fimbriimonadaceae bacterium]
TVILYDAGTTAGTFDARIRFLNNDGPNGAPGSQLYASGFSRGLQSQPGLNTYTFAIPEVVVPDHFTWTIFFENRTGGNSDLGPAYFDPPTLGASEDGLWLSELGSDWIQYSWGADPVANFGARVEAVPEPASVVALTIGVLALRRRKDS